MPRIVLASQSASRRRLLESAGLSPTIMVSNVDEETDFFNAMTPEVDVWMLIEKQEQFLAFSYFALIQTLCVEVGLSVKQGAPKRCA